MRTFREWEEMCEKATASRPVTDPNDDIGKIIIKYLDIEIGASGVDSQIVKLLVSRGWVVQHGGHRPFTVVSAKHRMRHMTLLARSCINPSWQGGI